MTDPSDVIDVVATSRIAKATEAKYARDGSCLRRRRRDGVRSRTSARDA